MLFLFKKKVEVCGLLLLAFSFSCSGSVEQNNVDQVDKPKISSTLLNKLKHSTVSASSGEAKFKVGVLYKKDRRLQKTKKLIDVDYSELSASEILLLSQNDDVAFVEEDYKVNVNLIYASKQVGARDVWGDGYIGSHLGGTSQDIRIAVVDTGLDEGHLDFSAAGKIAGSANCYNVTTCSVDNQHDDHGHGTHVAGIILGGGESCVADDLYFEFNDPFLSTGLGDIYYIPAQFDTVPNSGGTLKADITWDGGIGSTAYSLFMTEEESIKTTPTSIDPPEDKSLAIAGPGISLGKYGNYTAVNIPAGQSSNIVPFAFSTYTEQSGLVGSLYWARVKSTAQGWGDAFSPTSGISYGAQIFAVKALGSDGSGNVSDIVRGLDHVADLAQSKNIIAVNLSFSLGGGVTSEIINSAVTELFDMGVVVVVSAGNDQQSGGVVSSPGNSPFAITVGAVNEKDEVTNYSSVGSIRSLPAKPDVVAPGGSIKGLNGDSYQRLGIVSAKTTYLAGADSMWNTTVGTAEDPYALKVGTSQASPMVAGLVGLMASKHQGAWDFTSSALPRLFKMIICMSAFETGAREDDTLFNNAPITPERAGGLKDRVEGYGRICTMGAMSAFDPAWNISSSTNSSTFTFGDEIWDQKSFIRKLSLSAAKEYTFSMAVPSGADYDMYLFDAEPDVNGDPVLVASSALKNGSSRLGPERIVDFIPSADGDYYIVAKWIGGSGSSKFTLESSRTKPTTPTTISNLRVNRNMRDKTIDVFWDTNVPCVSTVQHGVTGGLESEETASPYYAVSHSYSFSIEYENYYYVRVISSSEGTTEADRSTATSSVHRVSAVTQLVNDITVEDLPVVDEVGGCGNIVNVNGSGGGANGAGNILVVLLPIVVLFGLRIRRKANDKGLQLS